MSATYRRRVRSMAQARASLVLLTVAVGVLPGCASAQSAAPPTASTALFDGSALAFAHAVNLRASDLPELESTAPEAAAPTPGTTAFGMARCDGGISPARILVNIRSVLLSSGDQHDWSGVRSRVTVMPNEALARRNLAAFSSPRGRRCARQPGTSVSALSFPLPGGVHATGQRIIVPSAAPVHEPSYHDIVGFVYGPAEIVLTATGYSHPVATQTEQHLLDVLYRRAAQARSEL